MRDCLHDEISTSWLMSWSGIYVASKCRRENRLSSRSGCVKSKMEQASTRQRRVLHGRWIWPICTYSWYSLRWIGNTSKRICTLYLITSIHALCKIVKYWNIKKKIENIKKKIGELSRKIWIEQILWIVFLDNKFSWFKVICYNLTFRFILFMYLVTRKKSCTWHARKRQHQQV